MYLYYLAYGSNLHPLRLRERISSAELVERTILPDWELRFRKRGADGSAKADLAAVPGATAWGGIFRIHERDKPTLDRIEGLGHGYNIREISLSTREGRHTCFLYLADEGWIEEALLPFTWYRELVRLGAQYHDFPAEYIAMIEKTEAQEDPDPERRLGNELLCERVRQGR